MALPTQQGILPIEFLIGAPLEALVRAQALAAQATAQFVSEVGFETGRDGVSRARMVDFEYTHPKADPDQPGNVIDTPARVRVPLLSLLPVPSVAVSEASIDLQLRVVGQQTGTPALPAPQPSGSPGERTTAQPADGTARVGPVPGLLPLPESRLRLVGTIASPSQAEQTASLKVSIKVKREELPQGLSQILSLLGEATTARPIEER